jgi:hypothetical protein
VLDSGGQEKDLIYGMIVDAFAAFLESTGLAKATDDLVERIVRANPVLERVPDSLRSHAMGSASGLSLVLSGPSAVTGEEERVTVFIRELSAGHVLVALLVAPGEDYGELKATVGRMIGSLRAGDDEAFPQPSRTAAPQWQPPAFVGFERGRPIL